MTGGDDHKGERLLRTVMLVLALSATGYLLAADDARPALEFIVGIAAVPFLLISIALVAAAFTGRPPRKADPAEMELARALRAAASAAELDTLRRAVNDSHEYARNRGMYAEARHLSSIHARLFEAPPSPQRRHLMLRDVAVAPRDA